MLHFQIRNGFRGRHDSFTIEGAGYLQLRTVFEVYEPPSHLIAARVTIRINVRTAIPVGPLAR